MSNNNHKPGTSTDVSTVDTSPVRRDIGPLRIIAIGFNIPNSWVAIAASLSTALAAGGTVSLIYGTFVSCAFYACAAVTLAELASVYPTAGGQYHFTSILAPERYNRQFSYVCGMISTLSWTINAASMALIGKWVWTNFETTTGWNDGVALMTSLVTPCYMYGGLDAALHLAEETLNASQTVPRALLATIGIGFLTAFTFAVSMAYCISDLDCLLTSPMPIFQLWRTATRSNAAGVTFLVSLTIIVIFVLTAIQKTTSRLIWAFAKDHDLCLSHHFSQLSPKLGGAPTNALILNIMLVFFCGCPFLASTEAFNALVGSFLLLQMISFALPAALLIYQKHSSTFLPRSRGFRVPDPVGWICNFGTIVAAVIELVFFMFPLSLPVSALSMSTESFRLVSVTIDSNRQPSLTLQKHEISSPTRPEYYALSYTWNPPYMGDPAYYEDTDVRYILLNGSKFAVKPNLYDALFQLHHSYPRMPFWIDALCINQNDLHERKLQVGIMDRIFGGASRVVVWLGKPSDKLELGLQVAERIAVIASTACKAIVRDQRYPHTHHLEEMKEAYGLDPLSFNEADALVTLFSCRWFGRQWVIQEVALAGQIDIICNGMSVPFDKIGSTALFLHLSGLLVGIGNLLVAGGGGMRLLEDMHLMQTGRTQIVREWCKGDRSEWRDVLPLIDFTAGIVENAVTTSERKEGIVGVVLLKLLMWLVGFDCGDRRDTIYGLAGIISHVVSVHGLDSIPQRLQPDYRLNTATVLHNAATEILQATGSLALLGVVKDPALRETEGLPSWVPDYPPRMVLNPMAGPNFKSLGKFDASKSINIAGYGVNFHVDDKVLRARGFLLGRVKALGESLQPMVSGGSFAQCAAMLVDAEEIYRFTNQPFAEAFWRTLVFDQDLSDRPAELPTTKHFQDMVLMMMAKRISDEFKSGGSEGVEAFLQTLEAMDTLEGKHPKQSPFPTTRLLASFCSGFGFLPENGDDKVWSSGQQMAWMESKKKNLVFMFSLLSTTLFNRRPAITDGGHLACVFDSTMVDDEIWIVSGCPTPLVMRSKGQQYSLIGETYVHGIMYGEAIRDDNNGHAGPCKPNLSSTALVGTTSTEATIPGSTETSIATSSDQASTIDISSIVSESVSSIATSELESSTTTSSSAISESVSSIATSELESSTTASSSAISESIASTATTTTDSQFSPTTELSTSFITTDTATTTTSAELSSAESLTTTTAEATTSDAPTTTTTTEESAPSGFFANPSFEVPNSLGVYDGSPWALQDSSFPLSVSIKSGLGHTGSHSAYWSVTSTDTSARIQQMAALEANQMYSLSFWWYINTDVQPQGINGCSLSIIQRSGRSNLIPGTLDLSTTLPLKTWTKYDISFNSQTLAPAMMTFIVSCSGSAGTGFKLAIDDVDLVKQS
ncbi:heterokaryon incompatibility (het-6OR allele) [Fusarium circinatum]|uniref:Heterokaryon incompatibility (Het-6OR allele) n=1 Tax=Fusarium circinatum TaxID=48490 RepID=A0A8H5TK65_FUSCI|nr:heterokaryon incompatibility (het-6OR allele) [Fusarium circinatum]